MADRADFNSNRRFYRWTNGVAEYLEDMAGRERQAEVGTVAELLEEIESENLYQVLVTVDGRTLDVYKRQTMDWVVRAFLFTNRIRTGKWLKYKDRLVK